MSSRQGVSLSIFTRLSLSIECLSSSSRNIYFYDVFFFPSSSSLGICIDGWPISADPHGVKKRAKAASGLTKRLLELALRFPSAGG